MDNQIFYILGELLVVYLGAPTRAPAAQGRAATSGPEGPKGLISGKQPINLL